MKKIIRRQILAKRDGLTKDEVREKSKIICDKFLARKEFAEAERIFLFLSFGSEVDTDLIAQQSFQAGKKVYIPWIDKERDLMEAVQIDNLDDLEAGPFGIRQPKASMGELTEGDFRGRKILFEPSPVDSVETVDKLLVCVPGLAFDRRGFRVGYGKGYYDRFFARLAGAGFNEVKKIALGFQLQIIEELPAQEHDVAVDLILTEEESIEIISPH